MSISASNYVLNCEAYKEIRRRRITEKFATNIDVSKMDVPKSLNIITGTGMSHRRLDGINVISLASLGV